MRVRRYMTIATVLISLAGVASADDSAARTKAMRAMLDKHVVAWQSTDDDAKTNFKASLAPDALVSFSQGFPRTDFQFLAPSNVSHLRVARSKSGWAGSWGWIAAEVTLTSRHFSEGDGPADPNSEIEQETWHWIEVVVPAATGNGVEAKYVRAYRTREDDHLYPMNEEQTYTPWPTTSPLIALLAQPAAIAKQLSTNPATTVFGTADGDIALGPADAKKLVAGWQKLQLQVVDTPREEMKDSFKPVEGSIGDVQIGWAHLRMMLTKQRRWISVDGFIVARKTATGFEVIALSYGID